MLTAFLVLLYFVPVFVGWRHPHFRSIAVVNVFLGWTLIGWVVALAWAVIPVKQGAVS